MTIREKQVKEANGPLYSGSQRGSADGDAVGQRGQDAAELSDGGGGQVAEAIVALDVRYEGHHFDLGEVDAQANSGAAAEGRQ
jgi:hypothetical protein